MGAKKLRPVRSVLWGVAQAQHGVVSRQQLLELGYSAKAIQWRIANGGLHPLWRGVYAIGRPAVTTHGRWLGAVLSCGPNAVLSHESAAALWMIRPLTGDRIDVSVPGSVTRWRLGIAVHRRPTLGATDVTRRHSIPVTTPVWTLIDLATRLDHRQLEKAINEADKRDLTNPEELRSVLGEMSPRPGVRALRGILDRRTFTLTDSELERKFLPIARRAGLSRPLTGQRVTGFKVDFYWPDLGLIVETDGLRYHRTPAQQAKDRLRDQSHAAAGLTPLRFTHAQVSFEPRQVQATLAAVTHRLRARPAGAKASRPKD
jgi:very-short-patch-repair endonuclease